MAELLEPAIDGPPSPERLRQLSKQAKRASHLRRIPGHRTASSGSSSLRSATGERPAWELALENMSLARKSSARSTASSITSKDRDSVQFLGRGIFQRKNKAHRESKSSSGSSMYSAETSTDNSFVTGSKETLSVPSLFARRRPMKDDAAAAAAAQRRLQISGPFNFEHLASTRKEHVPDPSAFPASGPTSAPATRSIEAQYSNSAFSSPETIATRQFGPLTAPIQRPSLLPHHTAPAAAQRRLVKHARSQDHLHGGSTHGSAPPRPPRSPKDPMPDPATPPVPPPRGSSQRFDGVSTFDRPQTSGGFRRPQPFSMMEPEMDDLPPPATSHGYVPPPSFDTFGASSYRFSHAITTPDDAAWPLSSPEVQPYESPLADVPEEEEHQARRSRLSLASNNSSLRGSQSVPMLRSLADSQRPMSGASDTLGRLEENFGMRRPSMNGRNLGLHGDSAGANDNWEDCIDYCYEHEADANFDYEWERTSVEADRAALHHALREDEDLSEARTTPTSARSSPLRKEMGKVPIGQAISLMPSEGALNLEHPGSNNFSMPRAERNGRLSYLNVRPMSCASSFKESQGFNLSPSLLIPGDYHQQMLLSASENYGYDAEAEIPPLPYRNPEDEHFEASLALQQRSSTSTTESTSTAPTDFTGERHTSANSSWTASTRLTASTTSLTKLASSVADTTHSSSMPSAADGFEAPPQTNMDEVEADAVPDLIPFPATTSVGKRSHHKSHASESVVREEFTPLSKSMDGHRTRRPRARTTSLSQQAPPVGQYALFPRTYVKTTGDRI